MKVILWFIILVIFVSICSGVSTSESPESRNVTDSHVKSLVMVYIVGSDLESDGGEATANVKQMIEGVGDIVPGDLQILVAYGGSRKPGWKGMTITTYDQLKNDLHNGVIGDEDISSFSDSSIDMGSPIGLKTFIEWTKERYSANNTYLILWDHGSGYEGYGSDENSGNMQSVSNIKSVFHETDFKPDVIGFDACLMSELEVAYALSPYGTYFIGSEETEPGSGWEYNKWLHVLAQDPSQNPVNVSKTIVDSFVDGSGDGGRTLAVIDLKKVPDIVSRLDEFGISLSQVIGNGTGFRILGKAYRNTTKFAQEPGNEGGVSVDLPLLIQYMTSHVPASDESGVSINDSMNKAIIYERHDKYISDARGLSILDPQGITPDLYVKTGEDVKLTPGWDAFIEDFLNKQSGDTEKPLLNSTGENTYEITDSSGTASVWVDVFALDPQGNIVADLGNIPAEENSSGFYSIPDWDGKWYYLKDNSDPLNHALVGMSYEDVTEDGIIQYSSLVNLTHEGKLNRIYLYSYMDPDTGNTDLEFRPYSVDNDGEVLLSRAILEPVKGDTIETYAPTFDPEGSTKKWVQTGNISVEGSIEMVHDTLPDGQYAIGLYSDYGNGYRSYSDLKKVEISNGQVTQDGNLVI